MEELYFGSEEFGVIAGYISSFTEGFWDFLPKIALAILVLVVGLFIIKYIKKALFLFFQKTEFDEVLEKFLYSFIGIILKVILLVIVISILGVKIGAFIAIFGAMVFAIGMALQGSLSNFAGGVLILFFKPFKIGDYIETEGIKGIVVDMQIFNTIIETFDGQKVILPNGAVSNGTIVNWSSIQERRFDIIVKIGYKDNVEKAKEVLKRIADSEERILNKKGTTIVVQGLGDNSVDLLFRVWTKNSDYLGTKFDMIEKIKLTFDKEGISFPFPQREVHLHKIPSDVQDK